MNRIYHFRWVLLAGYAAGLGVALWWLLVYTTYGPGIGLNDTPLMGGFEFDLFDVPAAFLVHHLAYLLFLAAMLWLFFTPRSKWMNGQIGLTDRDTVRIALPISLALTAAIIALLATVTDWAGIWSAMNWTKHETPMPSGPPRIGHHGNPWPMILITYPLWLGLFMFLLRTARNRDAYRFRTRVLQACTLLGLLAIAVSVPTYLVRLQQERPADEVFIGSYTGCVFGFSVLLWTGAAGLAMLFQRHRRDRQFIPQ